MRSYAPTAVINFLPGSGPSRRRRFSFAMTAARSVPDQAVESALGLRRIATLRLGNEISMFLIYSAALRTLVTGAAE